MIYEDSVSDITGYHIKMLISNISDNCRTNTSFDRFYGVHWSQHKTTTSFGLRTAMNTTENASKQWNFNEYMR